MKKILTILALISGLVSAAQNVKLSKSQLSANIVPLTLTYEGKIDANKSFTLSAGIVPAVVVETRSSGLSSTTETYTFFQPHISGSFRNYYSRNNIKKSNLRNNSGNYWGLLCSHWLKPFGSSDDIFEQGVLDQKTNYLTVGPVWGFERNYASGIHLDLNIGLGYTNGEFLETGDIAFVGQFEIGFVLFSK